MTLEEATGIWAVWPKQKNQTIRSESHGQQLTVGLISDDFLDVEAPPSAVDRENLAFATLEGSTHDSDGVALPHGDGSNVVLSPEILAQMTTHDLSPDA